MAEENKGGEQRNVSYSELTLKVYYVDVETTLFILAY